MIYGYYNEACLLKVFKMRTTCRAFMTLYAVCRG